MTLRNIFIWLPNPRHSHDVRFQASEILLSLWYKHVDHNTLKKLSWELHGEYDHVTCPPLYPSFLLYRIMV